MISIIIPALNEEKIIAKTLTSLRKLTLPHEIIVSDGGSKDKTAEIAREYADKVIVHTGEKRQTIAQGRNEGAKHAQGDFLVFFDADCSIPDMDAFFRIALSDFEKNLKLVALTASLRVLPDNETWADRFGYGILNTNVKILNNILHLGEAAGEFQMMRKSTFEKVGGFREDLVTREDADMFKRLSKLGRTMSDPRLTVYHTGRRPHKEGWPNVLWTWSVNTVWVFLFDKSVASKWEEIR